MLIAPPSNSDSYYKAKNNIYPVKDDDTLCKAYVEHYENMHKNFLFNWFYPLHKDDTKE